jgi:hypothetical protein
MWNCVRGAAAQTGLSWRAIVLIIGSTNFAVELSRGGMHLLAASWYGLCTTCSPCTAIRYNIP